VHSYVVSGFLIQLFDYCHVLNFYVRFDSELVYSTMNLCEGLKDIDQKWSMSRAAGGGSALAGTGGDRRGHHVGRQARIEEEK
jgi:hypothetical protein